MFDVERRRLGQWTSLTWIAPDLDETDAETIRLFEESETKQRTGSAEAFRKLRTNLRFMDVDNPPRVIVVTSPQQGRAFEVSRDRQVAFELVNPKPGDDKFNYVISELNWVPETFFAGGLPDCASGGQ